MRNLFLTDGNDLSDCRQLIYLKSSSILLKIHLEKNEFFISIWVFGNINGFTP